MRESSKLIIPMVSIKDTNLAQEKFCIKLQMLSFISSVLGIYICSIVRTESKSTTPKLILEMRVDNQMTRLSSLG